MSVIPFRGGHSTLSRAAKRVNVAALIPADLAAGKPITVAHQPAGIESLCHHLLTKRESTSSSAANASREGQSSMMRRNDLGVMLTSLRHSVLNVKDGLSSDCDAESSENVDMAGDPKDDLYTKQLVLRTRAARSARVPKTTQDQIADLLHIDQPTYSKYESPGRPTRIPHELIWAFCNICGINTEWFLTGRGKGLPIESMTIFDKKNIRRRKQPKKVRAA